MLCDVVVDLAYGDCGKGVVTHDLLKHHEYTHVMRWAGGANAGHTVYHNGEKIVTHLVPMGVLHGIKSIVGPGCVIHPKMFLQEIEELERHGFRARELTKVAKNAHIVTDAHLLEDGKESSIGTTKRGIGPAYRDKYGRTGVLAEACPELRDFVIDLYQELHESDTEPVVLCEGAQGYGLDVMWGDYPYVTSSHCTVAGALLNGFPAHAVRKVYGVTKAYETYVGAKKFQGDDPIFEQLQRVGKEFGATTGRPRQCNFLNLDLLRKAIKINGVTDLIVKKMDVMQEVGIWKVRNNNDLVNDLESEGGFKDCLANVAGPNVNVSFSYSPEKI